MNSITFSSSAFVVGDLISARRSLSMPTTLRLSAAAVRAAKAAPAAEGGKRQPRGITKPKPVSPALQALVGVKEIPRTQALKVIWAYIKENNLQDPVNKKIIVCDEKLKKLFLQGRTVLGFLKSQGCSTLTL